MKFEVTLSRTVIQIAVLEVEIIPSLEEIEHGADHETMKGWAIDEATCGDIAWRTIKTLSTDNEAKPL